MDNTENLKKIAELDKQEDELRHKMSNIRVDRGAIMREVANATALEAYGLQVGDKIEYKKLGKTIRLLITSFEAYIRAEEGYVDERPSIHGKKILKDGSVGSQSDTIYSFEEREVKKLES